MKTIIVLHDTWRKDYLKIYNEHTDVQTPNLDQFAKDSIVFENHYVGSMPCMPARRDLFTGRLNFLERSWGPIEIFDQTLPKILKEGGIRSHIITDHAHYFRIGGENYCQQFDTYEFFRGQESDPWISLIDDPEMPEDYYGDVKRQYECNRQKFVKEEDFPSVKCFGAAEDWVDANKGADDFLLMVETFDPHEPFDLPDKYLQLYHDDYKGPRFDLPTYHKIENETEAAIEHLKRRYKGLMTMMDYHFGKFIQKLKDNNMYDDTMIIVTTDHGYCLGERTFLGKNYMPLYNEIANIPLIIHMPNHKEANTRRTGITQNIDVMPTLLDYANIDIPERVRGISMKSLIETNNTFKEYALYGTHGLTTNIFNGQYTYMRAPRNKECYEYTTSLTTIRGWLGKDKPEKVEMGYYLKGVPYPMYKVPVIKNALISNNQYLKDDGLYNIERDPEQQNNITDSQVINNMKELMSKALDDNEAPEEQYKRMGLIKAS